MLQYAGFDVIVQEHNIFLVWFGMHALRLHASDGLHFFPGAPCVAVHAGQVENVLVVAFACTVLSA